ncbi:MAG: hypothetical protein MK098_11835 [Marinovum sp.]|nr:hypothetical protein [Marinovum sp.]
MIDVKVSGKKATLIRSYTFPATPPLEAFPLRTEQSFDLPLAGLDPKSPSAKRILSKFASTYKKAVVQKEKSRNSENDKIWALAAKEIGDRKDPKKVQKDTQERLRKKWTEFFDKELEPAIYDVVVELADEDLKASKIPRAKATSMKDYFSGITLGAGILGVGKGATAAAAAAAAGASLILPLAVTAGAIVASLVAARKVSERIYQDIDIVNKRIDKALEDIAGTASSLKTQVETLEKRKQQISATMIKSAAQIKDLEREAKSMAAIAKKENIHKERIKVIGTQIKAAKDALKQQGEARKKMVGDIKAVEDLMRHAKIAADKFKADRSWYDTGLKHADALASAVGTIDTIVGEIKKDEAKKSK